MNATQALTRTLGRALLYGCLLWSAVMIGASSVHTSAPHAGHLDTLDQAGAAALPGG